MIPAPDGCPKAEHREDGIWRMQEKNQKKATVHTERQGLTGICYDMKRLIHVIICGFIRWKCPEKTAKAVFGYLRN